MNRLSGLFINHQESTWTDGCSIVVYNFLYSDHRCVNWSVAIPVVCRKIYTIPKFSPTLPHFLSLLSAMVIDCNGQQKVMFIFECAWTFLNGFSCYWSGAFFVLINDKIRIEYKLFRDAKQVRNMSTSLGRCKILQRKNLRLQDLPGRNWYGFSFAHFSQWCRGLKNYLQNHKKLISL